MNLDELEIVWFDEQGNPVSDEEEEKEIPSNNEWIKRGNDYFPAKDTKVVKKLPKGFYDVGITQGTYFASKRHIENDELVQLPNIKVDKIVDEIKKFWSKIDLFAKYNILHKRGILLHGRPGCGKSSIISMLSEEVVKRGGIVFQVSSINDLKSLIVFIHDYFRDIHPTTPIVVIIEDIDSLVRENESVLLNFLNGTDQFNHCVTVATTNRYHELNDLLLRPSRFDIIEEILSPVDEGRMAFLLSKDLPQETVDLWVSKTDKFSMAQLKELFIAVHLLDNDLDETIKKLLDQAKGIKVSTSGPATGIGFR